MLQIQIVTGENIERLNINVNKFLATINSDAVKNIDVNVPNLTAIIQYKTKEIWQDRLCSECKYWDDSGSSDAVTGLCQECGGRRRFNCKACESFKDLRG